MRHHTLTALVIALFALTPAIAEQPEGIRIFGQCLADKGATMYGATWCPYCVRQLKEFDASHEKADMVNVEKMKKFPFVVDCTGSAPYSIKKQCLPEGAKGVPMWTFKNATPPNDEDGKPYAGGGFSLEDLAKFSGCPLPK